MPDASQPQTALPPLQKPTADLQGKKNIVVCCDGTGNEFGNSNSNVVKLYTALAIDNDQVGYYHPGVGTMGAPGESHAISRWWSQVKGLAFAEGFRDNVLDAYRYLMSIYNDGDRVYLFGFSRGSYTARALAGVLDGYGLLCQGNEGHLPYAWRLYVNQHEDRNRHSIHGNDSSAAAFKETFSRKNFTIHFVGIWDTVSSVGWVSTPLRLFNVSKNPTILTGRHAVSIDERRCFYLDNLWGEAEPGQNLLQLWFAGAHSDVGGSYCQDESVLPNITLKWMIDEARAAGAKMVEERVAMVLGTPTDADPNAQKLYLKPTQSIVHHSLNWRWWALELLPHLYYDKDDGQEHYRIPLGGRRKLPHHALLHPSVAERIADKLKEYDPTNVTRGQLNPVLNPGVPFHGSNEVYSYHAPADDKDSTVARLAILFLFCAVYLVIAICVVGLLLWLCWHFLTIIHNIVQCCAAWRSPNR